MGSRLSRTGEALCRRWNRSVASACLLWCTGLLLAVALPESSARAAVVINEIHYHPPSPGGKTLEFIELFNDSGAAVDIGGWSFSRGIDFTFAAGSTIPAGGFVVVCRDPEEARRAFGLGEEGVFGPYLGVLDNGGENVVLVDAVHGFADGVDFDDNSPWPLAADGDGASLQRVCSTGPSWSYRNWSGAPGQDPSPLGASPVADCPLPPAPPPRPRIWS